MATENSANEAAAPMRRRRRPAENHHFGYGTYYNARTGEVHFCDNGRPIEEEYFERKCPVCGECRTSDGRDPCLGSLPGVRNACCGHGVEPGYVMFDNGTVIRGDFRSIERKTSIPSLQLGEPSTS